MSHPSAAPPNAWGAADFAVGAALFVVASAFAWTWGWHLADDSWLMQVTNRFLYGEILYRNVYLHITPLSIYLLALPAAIFGPQILVLRIEIALIFAAVAIVACRINEQLGASRRYPPLLILSLVVFASPARLQLVAHYNSLATLFILVAFSLWLSWRASGRVAFMWGAGAALGACFAAKQTCGGYGAIALAISTIAVVRAERWSAGRLFQLLIRAGAAFVAVALVAILPMIVTGSFFAMIASTVLGHGTYLRLAGMPYLKPILSLESVLDNPLSLDSLRYLNAALPYFFPFLVAPLLVATFVRSDRRERALTIAVASFTIATLAIIYPRADPEHMLFATPMLLVALAFGWRRMGWSAQLFRARVLASGAFAITAAAAALMTWSAAKRAVSPNYVSSSIPLFRGPLIAREIHDSFKRNLANVSAFPRDGRTFFLGPYASFYYLAAGMHNPSRYDYPYEVALRQNGVAEIIAEIQDGKISAVCLDRNGDPQLKPYDLQRYVERNMIRLPAPDFCEQYVRPR